MISVVGIGPSREDMTLRALKTIQDADVVIGYKAYIKHIQDLVEEKEVISKGMGQELSRAELAIAESRSEKNVVLVSSGDPGVFGMANVLFALIGKYEDIKVEVVPGISAVNFASSLLGAPLHDFAVISLSDLLTPLSEIKCKVKKACEGDFVIAFYNPLSKTRKKPFNEALHILQGNKKPSTPVGLVKSEEGKSEVKITSLEKLPTEEVNMSTIVIVGNSMSYVEDDWMVTPRGYRVPYTLHPLGVEFYEKYLAGEGVEGPNLDCEYYPCHSNLQNCTFCYCPFYPCGDQSTGGHWIKEKGVWSCEDCKWIHEDKTVQCIQAKLPSIVQNIDDLTRKKKELLKLRRECIRDSGC